MAHSICEVYIHMVFSTKDRYPFLRQEWQADLYAVTGKIIKNIGGQPIKINGMENHVHILMKMPKEMDLAALARTVKANSSRWIHQNHQSKFAWQEGYAVFSVAASNLSNVKSYIENQEEHHKVKSYEEEIRAMLIAVGLNPEEHMI